MYKTPQEIVRLLIRRKLIVHDQAFAEKTIEENSYFSLQQYADLFVVNEKREFDGKTDFNDIVTLYEFDRDLKVLLLHELLGIESKIKTAMGETVSKRYGTSESDYLNPAIFNPQYAAYVPKTIRKIRSQKRLYGRTNPNLIYFRTHHRGIIPFWVLSRVITIGAVRDYFNILKPSDQDAIARTVMTNPSLRHRGKKLKQMIAMLADVRNMCAHDDMLVGFAHRRIDIGVFPEQMALELKVDDRGSPIQGKKDFTAILICIRNLVDPRHFDVFMGKLIQMIGALSLSIPGKTEAELIDYIGLPRNYAALQHFR